MSGSTITLSYSESAPHASGEVADLLVLLLECDRPLAGSACHRLSATDEIVIGRGSLRQSERSGARLQLRVPDGHMSTVHAAIRRYGQAHIISDEGSKNGLLINGRRVERQLLRDRDIIECGHTFFRYLMAQPVAAGAPLDVDVDGAALAAAADGLATFHEPLAAQVRALPDVARAGLSILLVGASGTGKELVARAAHALSERRGPFVEVRCGSLPENPTETDLFGAAGRVAAAGGTLFLDEIGDLPPRAQPALLSILDGAPLSVVASTHRDLGAPARQEPFRVDLLARLSGFTLRLPSLRERLEDFGLLTAALLARHGTPDTTLSCEALRMLLSYDWPLGVRELEHCLRAALAVSASSRIDVAELPRSIRQATAVEPAAPLRPQRSLTLEQLSRRQELCALLSQHRRNISAVARELGKDRVQIRRWIRQLDISLEEIAS
ncbi:MAG: sigma-54 dependent transcriptional regulator [Myxococcales bacterium]|nr:sigma-54 dependent transcriptional regulator [Myxococcales bacterium]